MALDDTPGPAGPELLPGSEYDVSNFFGGGISFHDGEVLSLSLDRLGVVLQMTILFPSYRTTPLRGFIAKLRFQEIDELVIDGFNFQNVIQEIVLKRKEHRISVLLAGLYGIECSFTCEKADVIEVTETDMLPGYPPDGYPKEQAKPQPPIDAK